MNAFRLTLPILALTALLALGGCASMTPASLQDTSGTITDESWESFGEVASAFEEIGSRKSNLDEIKKFGFGPRAKNVTLVAFNDLRNQLLSNNRPMTDLSEPVQDCLAVKDRCSALAVRISRTKTINTASFLSKVVLRKSRNVTTGWNFSGVLILKDNRAVYATYGGTPNVYSVNPEKRPLDLAEKLMMTGLFALLAF